VFNTETSHNITRLSILTGVLSKVLRELLKDGEGFRELHNHAIGKYFTDFITVDKENLHKVLLSDKSKLLIADMEMQSMQDTAVYCVLRTISDAVEDLQNNVGTPLEK